VGAQFLSKMSTTVMPVVGADIYHVAFLLLNSLLLGFFLSVVTYLTSKHFLKQNDSKYQREKAKLILGSSNILYLCLGLTGVMLLVNNNLARAFAIAAAIALVRFRIKLGPKSASSNILFGIIGGIACGLNEILLAWMITILYAIVSLAIFFFTRRQMRESTQS